MGTMDDSSKCFKLAMSTPAVTANISCSAGGNPVTITYSSVKATLKDVPAYTGTNTLPWVLPGDDVTFTISATGYITTTQTFSSIPTTVTFSVTLQPNFTDVKVSPNPNAVGVTIQYLNSVWTLVDDGAGSITGSWVSTTPNYVSLGAVGSTGTTISHLAVGSRLDFQAYYYNPAMGSYSWVPAGTTTVINEYATSAYVLNWQIATVTTASVRVTAPAALLPDTTYFIKVTYSNACLQQNCATGRATQSTYLTHSSLSSYIFYKPGESASIQIQYIRNSDGAVIYDGTHNISVVSSGNTTLNIGTDIMFMLPVTINSSPQGASVFYMDDPMHPRLGITPISLNAANGAGWGETDTLQFVLTGYVTQTVVKTWLPGSQDLTVQMVPQSWDIPVTSSPTGATVTETIGTTVTNWGNTPTTIKAYYGDIIAVTYSLAGYYPVTNRYTITNGNALPTPTLVVIPTSFQFTLASVPSGATAYVQNPDSTWTNMGKTPFIASFPISMAGTMQNWKLVFSDYNDLVFQITYFESVFGSTITKSMVPGPAKPQITAITWDKTSYQQSAAGGNAVVTVTVKNASTVTPYSAAGVVQLLLKGVRQTSLDWTLPSIAAGASVTHTYTIPLNSIAWGVATACAQFADGTNGLGTTTCGSALVAGYTDVHLVDGSTTTSGTPQAGLSVTWIATLANTGTMDSPGGHVIQLLWNGVLTAYTTTITAGIPAGQSVQVRVSAVITGPVGFQISGCLQLKAGT